MKPVAQSILPTEDAPLKGNCFAACLASLLELPLGAVPHVMEHPDWRERTNAWLAGMALATVEVCIDTEDAVLFPLPPGMLLIVTGRTGRHPERLHSVIGRTLAGGATWEYLHDPHPAGTFLTHAVCLMWVVPLDPRLCLAGLELAREIVNAKETR